MNATNVSADSWLFLNVTYDNSDITGLDESSLRMWRHDGATWSVVAGSGMNVAENYVYATITEFSVFAPMGNSGSPPVSLTISKTDGVEGCVNVDDTITYEICYENPNTRSVHNVMITDTLPVGVTFVLASPGGTHAAGVVTWNIDELDGNAAEACVTLTVRVNTGTEGTTLENCATIESDETDPAEACVTTDVCESIPPPTPPPTPINHLPVPAVSPPGVALMIGLLVVAGYVMLRRRE